MALARREEERKGVEMDAKLVSRKVLIVLAAIAVAFAASLLWGGQQAHAASTKVAHIGDSHGSVKGSYDDLQAAFDAVEDGQRVYLVKDVVVSKALRINRGKTFTLDLHGHTITSSFVSYNPILYINGGNVTLSSTGYVGYKQTGLIGKGTTRCIRLDSGRLNIWSSEKTVYKGGRVADVYGGELHIYGGTYENSIVINNSAARLIIDGGNFEKSVNISAKGNNACYMEINGGEFLAKLANTGKTGFIKGGKFHYLRTPSDGYINPEYYKVEDSITREGQTEKAYRIEKRPPSVAFTPDSGSVAYDPAGSGTDVTAKMVDSNGTTELKPATFKWYKDGASDPFSENQTAKLNEPGTYRAVGTYKNASYEAEYVVKPADISSGYMSSISGTQPFTGFPLEADFVQGNARLFKEGSPTPIDGFTFDVKSTGANTTAGEGSGTYTITGTGNYTGELSATFDIGKADFGKIGFTASPAEPTYTGEAIEPAVVGTLTTDGKVYTLDPSEYTVAYGDNTNAGSATITVTSNGKNFDGGTQRLGFTIEKAQNDVSVSMDGWAGGTAASTPRVTATANADRAVFAYKAKGASDDSYTNVAPSKPGDYTVKAVVPESVNYEAGVATADFSISPMQVSVASATASNRAYEQGNTAVDISGVTFTDSNGRPASGLTPGVDYSASGTMGDADAGVGKDVAVTVTLLNDDYYFSEGSATTATASTTTTVDIAKAAAPTIENVPFLQVVGQKDTYKVSQSLAGKMPSDAGGLTYAVAGSPTQRGTAFNVSGFNVSSDGTVTATITYTDWAAEGDQAILPVKIGSANYQDATVNVVVTLTVKEILDYNAVTIKGAPVAGVTYGDQPLNLTASVTGVTAGAGTWTWYSSDESVLKVTDATKGTPNARVDILKPGHAILAAVYEDDAHIGTMMTGSISVRKRMVIIRALSPQSIYVGGEVPALNGPDGRGADGSYSVTGLLHGDSLTTAPTLAYSPDADSAKPGTYAIVPSGADAGDNYYFNYLKGALTIMPKEAQVIAADDVSAAYGDTDKSVSARVTAPDAGTGAISYAVKKGGDCIDVDAATGALTIKKAGTATVTVTASETATCAQAAKDVTVTVGKAQAVPVTVTANEWTYDATQRPLAIVEGAVTGGAMQYSLDGSSFTSQVPTATDAGDYTVWYKCAGDENHADSEAKSVDVTVYKEEPDAPAIDTLHATYGDLLESVGLPTSANGTWSWEADPDARVEHAGECHFSAMFTPNDTANYSTLVGVPVTVVAAKGKSSVAAAPQPKALTFNGASQALVTAGVAVGGTMEYWLEGDEFFDGVPTGSAAGSYTVWYQVAGDEDHDDTEPQSVNATIAKATPSPQSVRVPGIIFDDEESNAKVAYIEQPVAYLVPADAGTPLTYRKGTPKPPAGVTVESFEVDSSGKVAATLRGIEEGENVILPVTVGSPNYEDATVNVEVVPTNKTYMEVTLEGAPSEPKTYGEGAFELKATVKDKAGAVVQTEDEDWYWYSSDPAVLEVAERGSSTMAVTVKAPGSAMVLAWYEPSDPGRNHIGAAITESIVVDRRPLTITARDLESIYVGASVPALPSVPAQGKDYAVDPAEGGLADGDTLVGPALAYSPVPDGARPGIYDVVPSGASVLGKDGADASANYSIYYVNGALTIMEKKTQTITAEDVTVVFGDTGKKVSATTDGDGAISYGVKDGGDCIDVDAATGALTIKKLGVATVTVTASETATCERAAKDVTVRVGVDISAAKVTLAKTSYTYNGKAKKPAVKSVELNGEALAAGADYTVSYKGNVGAGKATAMVKGAGSYAGAATATFKIGKAANKLTVKAAKKTVKASKKAQTVKPITKATPKFKAKVTYKKATTAKAKKMSGYKVLSVNKKTGKVTVKAGAKPGTYKLMVKVGAAKTANTKAASKTLTVTVKVAGKASKSLKPQAGGKLTAAAI